jgi:hypothetical protein
VLDYGLKNRKEGYSKAIKSLFTYYDLDEEGYRTASGDIML